jgi:hypothetical protein
MSGERSVLKYGLQLLQVEVESTKYVHYTTDPDFFAFNNACKSHTLIS